MTRLRLGKVGRCSRGRIQAGEGARSEGKQTQVSDDTGTEHLFSSRGRIDHSES